MASERLTCDNLLVLVIVENHLIIFACPIVQRHRIRFDETLQCHIIRDRYADQLMRNGYHWCDWVEQRTIA